MYPGPPSYQVADLSQPLSAYQNHFDLVASFFVLNDVPDYQGFLTTLGSVLKPAGRLVLFMNNPYSLVLRGHITDYFAASGQAVPYRGLAAAGCRYTCITGLWKTIWLQVTPQDFNSSAW